MTILDVSYFQSFLFIYGISHLRSSSVHCFHTTRRSSTQPPQRSPTHQLTDLPAICIPHSFISRAYAATYQTPTDRILTTKSNRLAPDPTVIIVLCSVPWRPAGRETYLSLTITRNE
jgi:hypothetical protein